MFIFGFLNPDPKNCYYYPGVDIPERDPLVLKTTALEMNLKLLNGYPVNMAHVYRLWFQWGFISFTSLLGFSIGL